MISLQHGNLLGGEKVLLIEYVSSYLFVQVLLLGKQYSQKVNFIVYIITVSKKQGDVPKFSTSTF